MRSLFARLRRNSDARKQGVQRGQKSENDTNTNTSQPVNTTNLDIENQTIDDIPTSTVTSVEVANAPIPTASPLLSTVALISEDPTSTNLEVDADVASTTSVGATDAASHPISAAMPMASMAFTTRAVAFAATPQAALNNMLTTIRNLLPTSPSGLPDASVSIVKAIPKPIGVGNRAGVEYVGSSPIIEIRGRRIEATMRVQLWHNNAADLVAAINDFQESIFANMEDLQTQGFIKINSVSTTSIHGENTTWTSSIDFDVLYEYIYRYVDDALSFIVRIPIKSQVAGLESQTTEQTSIEGNIAMWYHIDTCMTDCIAPFVIQAPKYKQVSIHGLSALIYAPLVISEGIRVSVTDGTAAPLVAFANWNNFIQAITDEKTPQRNAEITFATLNDFIAIFTPYGETVVLGDRDEDGNPDIYQPYILSFDNPVHFPNSNLSLTIAYLGANMPQRSVVYWRADKR